MRVRVSDASQLTELCDHLSRRGFVAVEASPDAANVLIPWAEDEFFAAIRLSFEIDLWRATHARVAVTVETVDSRDSEDLTSAA